MRKPEACAATCFRTLGKDSGISLWLVRARCEARSRLPRFFHNFGGLRHGIAPIFSLFREFIFPVARRFARVLVNQKRVHQPVHISIQHAIHIADRKLSAMVFDQPVWR